MGRLVQIVTAIMTCTCIFYCCSGDKLTNTVGDTGIVPRVLWKKGTNTVTPDEVDSVRVAITYDSTIGTQGFDSCTVTQTFPFSADTGTFESLPSGATINILIKGLDSNSIVVYRGTKDSILLEGDWVEVLIEAHEVTPIAPEDLKAVLVTHNTIVLNWNDNSSNETQFYLERKIGIDSLDLFDSLSIIGENESSFVDSGLSSLTTYLYRIYAQNSAGYSVHYSQSQPFTTTDTSDFYQIFISEQPVEETKTRL